MSGSWLRCSLLAVGVVGSFIARVWMRRLVGEVIDRRIDCGRINHRADARLLPLHAFARRADLPDPDSNGLPKTQVVSARKGDPSRFDSANSACRYLLPSRGTSGGNGETPAQIAQDWIAFRTFARCMRSHGVPNWPDPTSRSTSDSRPAFNITAVGLDGTSPQLRAKAQQCASLLHLGPGLPAAH